ncbi:unnamed protein product [Coregonus sp. 'balchen']|nr:unnamed protein product [Coregonus sp. 'balchen']
MHWVCWLFPSGAERRSGRERHRQVLEESQRLTELLNSQVEEEFGELDGRRREEEDGEEEDGESSRLWVDQFSPQHYTELLSDDFTNRCLLKWLKLWDQVVFGRERKTRPPPAERPDHNTANQGQGRFHSSNKGQGRFHSTNWSKGNFNQANQKFKTKSQITEEILEAELDQYKRPKYKVGRPTHHTKVDPHITRKVVKTPHHTKE